MALDNIPTLGPGSLNSNLDKVLVYKNGGSEVAVSLLTLTNSALNLSGVYLDTVNGRMGIGVPNPTSTLEVSGTINGFTFAGASGDRRMYTNSNYFFLIDNSGTVFQMQGGKFSTSQFEGTAKFNIRGSGSTSATSSLIVQNSNGLANLQITDDGQVSVNNEGKFSVVRYGNTLLSTGQSTSSLSTYNSSVTVTNTYVAFNTLGNFGWAFLQDLFQGYHPMIIQDATFKARESSALVELNSKTRGFLKPKMTTAQKNAIVTPTAGLEIYDTDLNRPCFYNGTSWITL
jgi:hypothetical protein